MFRAVMISVKTFVESAAKGQYAKVAQYIMQHQKDPDATALNAGWKNGDTALIAAVIHDQVNIVSALLRTPGVNVNAANHDGNTPLFFAAVHGRVEIVDMLLARKALIVNAVNQDGFTALSKAAAQGRLEIVKKLLKVDGINITLLNIFGRNAAEEAVAHGQTEIAEIIYAYANAAHIKISANAIVVKETKDEYDESKEFTYDEAAMCRIC